MYIKLYNNKYIYNLFIFHVYMKILIVHNLK